MTAYLRLALVAIAVLGGRVGLPAAEPTRGEGTKASVPAWPRWRAASTLRRRMSIANTSPCWKRPCRLSMAASRGYGPS